MSGLSSTSATGVIDPADQFMGLTGQSSTVNQGTAVAPNEDVSVTGQAITSSQGTAAGITSHEADEKLTSEKSHIAGVLDEVGGTLVNVAPPEV